MGLNLKELGSKILASEEKIAQFGAVAPVALPNW
jgi:hypothetical protein